MVSSGGTMGVENAEASKCISGYASVSGLSRAWCLQFGVKGWGWGLGVGVWGLGVWGLGFGDWGLGFEIWCSGFRFGD